MPAIISARIVTTQVRVGQKALPTGLVYEQNEATLMKVGAAELERMLVARDWTPLGSLRVDRKNNEASERRRSVRAPCDV